MSERVPPVGPIGEWFGLEPYELIAERALGSVALKSARGFVQSVLASDPRGLFDIVALTTAGANGLRNPLSIFDEFRINFALTANDLGHDATLHRRFGGDSCSTGEKRSKARRLRTWKA